MSLSQAEQRVVTDLGYIWNAFCGEIVQDDISRQADLDEAYFHIHALQRMVMAQSAARQHPDQFRLLGGVVR